MSKQKVLLLGATGETGGDILDGLVEDGNFEIALLVQPSSAQKPAVKALESKGFKIVIGDLSGNVDDLAKAISGYDILLSAIGAPNQTAQLALVDAAAKAGIKRFVPCGYTIVCPPNGVMHLRDEKEEVYQRTWFHHLPYTIIDVGYWHQISFFRVPSGKFDYVVLLERNEIYGDGNAKTLLTDKRDIGRFVARIIQDPRTLNQKVFTWSDEISQNEIVKVIEKKTGEKLELNHVSEEQLRQNLADAHAEFAAEAASGTYGMARMYRSQAQYNIAKYIREDNTIAMGKYLGYLNARELYPDFKPITFEAYVDELIAGTLKRPYQDTLYKMLKEATKKL